MYQKRTANPPVEQYPSYSVLQAVLEYEERVAFVETVCAPTECRFGSHRASRLVNADINPQIETPLFDPPDEDLVLFYEISLKRVEKEDAFPMSGAVPRRKNVSGDKTSSLAANRGRGSPKISRSVART